MSLVSVLSAASADLPLNSRSVHFTVFRTVKSAQKIAAKVCCGFFSSKSDKNSCWIPGDDTYAAPMHQNTFQSLL